MPGFRGQGHVDGDEIRSAQQGLALYQNGAEFPRPFDRYIVATNLFRRCLPTTYRGGIATFGGLCERFATDRYCTKEHIPL